MLKRHNSNVFAYDRGSRRCSEQTLPICTPHL
jgi:hypothetical protein